MTSPSQDFSWEETLERKRKPAKIGGSIPPEPIGKLRNMGNYVAPPSEIADVIYRSLESHRFNYVDKGRITFTVMDTFGLQTQDGKRAAFVYVSIPPRKYEMYLGITSINLMEGGTYDDIVKEIIMPENEIKSAGELERKLFELHMHLRNKLYHP